MKPPDEPRAGEPGRADALPDDEAAPRESEPELVDVARARPPSGPDATCAWHPDRPAFVACPVCGEDVCLGCYFADLERCQRCVEQRPEDVTEPVPVEVRGLRGFGATLWQGFSPRRASAAYAIETERSHALAFFVATFFPFAMLRGIVPYTELVRFGTRFHVEVAPGATTSAIALDAARAAGLALAESAVTFAAFAICFRSLAVAFGRPETATIVARALAYRGFLMPLGGATGLFASISLVANPLASTSSAVLLIVHFAAALPMMLFMLSLHRVVRTTCRVDLFPGVATILVPFLLYVIVTHWSETLMGQLVHAFTAPT